MAATRWRAAARRHGGLWIGLAGGIGTMLVLLLVLGLAGVIRFGSGAAATTETGDLVVMSGADDSQDQQRLRRVQVWNETHPDHQARIVQLSSRADGQHSQMVADAQSGRSEVDIYNLDVTWVTEFAAAGYIRPLSDVNTDGFLAKPLETGMYAGKQWALPFNTDAGLLYYWPDLIKLPPGAQLPPSRKDVEQTLADHSGLTAGYAGQFADYEGLTVNAIEAIWAAGGNVVEQSQQDQQDQPKVMIDSKEAEAGLRRLSQAIKAPDGLRPAALNDTDETSSTAAFVARDVAMMRNWPVQYSKIKDSTKRVDQPTGVSRTAEFAVTKLPGSSALGGQDLAVSASSTKPRLAQELIEFLTSAESQAALFGEGGLPAVREETYADPAVQRSQPYAGAVLEAVRNASLRPVTPHYAVFSAAFRSVVLEALGRDGVLPTDAVPRLTAALRGEIYS